MAGGARLVSGQCTLQHLFLSPHEKKMGQGATQQEVSKAEESVMYLDGYQVCSGKQLHYGTIFAIIIVLMVVIGLATGLGVKRSGACSASEKIVTYPLCPDGWIGYLGKCYYFSEDEADWLSSLRNCSFLGATLSLIETEQEMGFLMRYKGPIYHWIGLRQNQEKLWEWVGGRVFNNMLFDIVEGADCAYLNDVAVMSSWCKTKKNWICSKPDAYMQQRTQAEKREM